MSKTAIIQVRVEPEVKREAEAMLKKLGLTISQYINLAIHQLILEERIPFDVKLSTSKSKK